MRIVPFRGSYMRLRPHARALVRGLIYPVPDPSLPFLGVHLTKTIHGDVWLGPTALLAPSRRAYALRTFDLDDARSTLTWPGTWRMARKFWRTGITEMSFAARNKTFIEACAAYVPALNRPTSSPAPPASEPKRSPATASSSTTSPSPTPPGALHVRNAPSPAATSSLAIARVIADRLGHASSMRR